MAAVTGGAMAAMRHATLAAHTSSTFSLFRRFVSTDSLRKTRICCTIGPASEEVEEEEEEEEEEEMEMEEMEENRKLTLVFQVGPLGQVVAAGMAVMRCNFSHGQYEEQGRRVERLRSHLDSAWKTRSGGLGVDHEKDKGICAIAVDLKGREVRTGMLVGGKKVKLDAGREILLRSGEGYRLNGSQDEIFVDYPLAKSVALGQAIYIDDGLIHLEVVSIEGVDVRCIVRHGGLLGERKGINVPGAALDLPAITDYDKSVLKWAAEKQIDMVFASFIESQRDIIGLREYLKSLGPDGEAMQVFAKIESQRGVDNMSEIINSSDGILVARGDLGIEVPVEDVPWMQKSMIHMCNSAGKPVVCATQMLETMEKRPRPSRAEASDVANAVIDGADVLMLSGETANGDHPHVVVETMGRIAAKTEAVFGGSAMPPGAAVSISVPVQPERGAGGFASSQCRAAMIAAAAGAAAGSSLLVLPAVTGSFAAEVAKLRPNGKILAPTISRRVANTMLMRYGLRPLLLCEDAVRSKLEELGRREVTKVDLELILAQLAVEWAVKGGELQRGEEAVAVLATADGVPRLTTLKSS